MTTDYKKLYAIKKKNEEVIRAHLGRAEYDGCGIYCFYRTDEAGIKHAYIGQAKHLIGRMAEHLSGYQYIDLSLRKHGFYAADTNPYGYHATVLQYCPHEDCDALEQYYIKKWADDGYQLKNRTSGSQGTGKAGIAEQKPSRGYYDGKKQGYEDARKFIAKLFDKNLVAEINGKPNKNKEKALEKFNAFIGGKDGQVDGEGK